MEMGILHTRLSVVNDGAFTISVARHARSRVVDQGDRALDIPVRRQRVNGVAKIFLCKRLKKSGLGLRLSTYLRDLTGETWQRWWYAEVSGVVRRLVPLILVFLVAWTTGVTGAVASYDPSITYVRALPVVGGKEVKGYGGTGRMIVQERPQTLWKVVVDFAHHPQIFTAVRTVKVRHVEAGAKVVTMVVDAGLLTVRYTARYVFDAEQGFVTWHMVPDAQNNLRSNVGYVKLKEVSPGWTQVVYSVSGDLKGTWLVPAFLKRFVAKREVLRAMHDFRRYVEDHLSSPSAH